MSEIARTLLERAVVVRFGPSVSAVAHRVRLCLTAGWLGLAGLTWVATPLGTGEVIFLAGGPLGGLSVWSCSSGDDKGYREDPRLDADGRPPEWDWERFERDLTEYEARRAGLRL